MNRRKQWTRCASNHQWLPDVITYERFGFSPGHDRELERRGHALKKAAPRARRR